MRNVLQHGGDRGHQVQPVRGGRNGSTRAARAAARPRLPSATRRTTALARTLLAHAIARQNRAAEARETLRPALEHCQRAQKAGATGLTYRRDCAYALYVSSLTESDDAAGRAKHVMRPCHKRPA